MDRIAVFVDAGYLFAQGSAALNGAKLPRAHLSLNDGVLVETLTRLAREKSGNLSLLRIYWYDGINSYHGPGAEQTRLSRLDNIKVRYGFLNNAGQQKGVDSLIITDLIDLARNGAISDALLLSGDDDLRIGVQVAQSFGVRVHLVGIAPSRGSQSLQLIQESDTTTEWDKAVIASFLMIAPTLAAAPAALTPAPTAAPEALPDTHSDPTTILIELVDRFVIEHDQTVLQSVRDYMRSQRGTPPDFDRQLLGLCRNTLNRPLTEPEKRLMRMKLREQLNP